MREVISLLLVVATCAGCNNSYKQLKKDASHAQASLTNFIGAVQSPTTNKFGFAMMTYLTSKRTHVSKLVWVSVQKYDNGVFHGAISADASLGLKTSQPFNVPATNVTDWVYFEFRKDGLHEEGNFTGTKHG